MSLETSRNWNEIVSHKYNFNKQAKSLKMLKLISKEDLQKHFVKIFFSKETKRLDLEITDTPKREE